MATYMLDTDSVSLALRGEGQVGTHILERRPSELCISSITLAELRFGAQARNSKRLHQLISSFVASVTVVPFDQSAATKFGFVAAFLKATGTPIGNFDTLLASHALALNLVFITNNQKHFRKVPNLQIENWK